MRSVVLSVLLCTFCIHQGYSASLPEPVPDDYKNNAACLAEQKLDLSVFGASSWKDFERDDRFEYLRTLEESKRNALLACLLHHKPFNGLPSPFIIKAKDGTYQIDNDGNESSVACITKACKEHERDLNKFAGCWYDNSRFEPIKGQKTNEPFMRKC